MILPAGCACQEALLALCSGCCKHTVAVTYYATHGGVLAEHTLADVTLAAGAKVFLSSHLLR